MIDLGVPMVVSGLGRTGFCTPCSPLRLPTRNTALLCRCESKLRQPVFAKKVTPSRSRIHQSPVQHPSSGDQKDELVTGSFGTSKPENARQAISNGLEQFGNKRYTEALKLFEVALRLPGSAEQKVSQSRGEPSQISTSEKIAALYNAACCHAKLKQTKKGILALGACMHLGYKDFDHLEADPDLAPLQRDPRFQLLVVEYVARAMSEKGGDAEEEEEEDDDELM